MRSSIAAAGVRLKPAPASKHRRRKNAAAFVSIHDQWLYALRSPDGVMAAVAGVFARAASQEEPSAPQAFRPIEGAGCHRLQRERQSFNHVPTTFLDLKATFDP